LLGSVDPGESVVVADFEAGLGTLTRLGDVRVDVVVVVVEPMAKSIEVGTRAAAYAAAHTTDRVVVVANRIRNDDDLASIRLAFADVEVIVVPEDPAIGDADRRGVAPLDVAPGSPGVEAMSGLAAIVGR
jgi:CO dehydrogenase maturation factor